MSSLKLASNVSQAASRKDLVLIAGSAAALRKHAPWTKLWKGRWTGALADMARATSPGDFGKNAVTWPGVEGAPERVVLAVLPDSVSRHVSPSRAHAVQDCCSKSDLGGAGRAGVVLVLEDPAHWIPAAVAVARALPTYSRKTGKRRLAEVVVAAVDVKGKSIPPPPHALEIAEAARWAAAMVDRPTCEIDTASFVEEAKSLLKGLKHVSISVIVGDDLIKHGLGGIHAVGRAAAVAPRLLVLDHAPKIPRRTVALVGKGVVYDTGGLALKPRDGMTGMKGDMGGGAAVVGAFRALVASGGQDRVIALVPLAENAIGPNSYRNDDIIGMHSGKTVEVNNTDAEGRILLADAASYAVTNFKPDVLVDAATLTGAQVVATGRRHAAIVSNREGLERRAVLAGRTSGDLVHPLPFAPEFYQREFRSDVADMKNSVKDRANAQSSCAAQFVWGHIASSGVPWLHVDLAGPAHVDGKGTGFGVALLTEIVTSVEDADLRD